MSVLASTDMPNGGTKPIQDYWLTIDNAKKIAMQARTEIGNQVRDYFFPERFKQFIEYRSKKRVEALYGLQLMRDRSVI